MAVKKNNKTCIACGTRYTFCSGCAQYDHLPRWMAIFHEENCKDIYNTVNDYINSGLSKEDAKELLDKCDLSNKDKMHHVLLNAINEIYSVETVEEPEKNNTQIFVKKKNKQDNE